MKTYIIVNIWTLTLLVRECMSAPHLPTSILHFLRGGSTAAAATAATKSRVIPKNGRPQHRRKPPLRLGNLHHGLNEFGDKIQSNAGRGWNEMRSNLSQEWEKMASNAPRLPPLPKPKNPLRILFRRRRCGSNVLDEVVRTFELVHHGRDVDTEKLLRACRAHLALMKTSKSLRLVAKDLESNLKKTESLCRKSKPSEVRTLTKLLELERRSGIHNGNCLKDPSAAVGLLWIRRSIAFQSDLYASLIPSEGKPPRDSALEAYAKHIKPYHGWALGKIFPASLHQMPDRKVFIAKFYGIDEKDLEDAHEKEVVRKLRTLVDTWEPLLETWKSDFEEMDMEDTRKV